LERPQPKNEAAEAPELLLQGYYDPYDLPNEVLSGNCALILGPRGSGKSAITEHLRLESLQDSQLFVSRLELKNVYFSQFSSLVPDGGGDRTHYPTAWSWVLLLSLFASFSRDEGAFSNNDEDYRRTLQALTAVGFLPKSRLEQLFQVSTTSKIMLNVPGVQVGNEEASSQHGVQFYSAVDTLRQVAGTFHSDSNYIGSSS
jgi:energy-coupling factor transporter ATP-binding protein EcfA2